jgi:hypothetical protein
MHFKNLCTPPERSSSDVVQGVPKALEFVRYFVHGLAETEWPGQLHPWEDAPKALEGLGSTALKCTVLRLLGS